MKKFSNSYEKYKSAEQMFFGQHVTIVGRLSNIPRWKAYEFLSNMGAWCTKELSLNTNILIKGTLVENAKSIERLAEVKEYNECFIEMSEEEFMQYYL